MADSDPVEDKTKPIVRSKPGKRARASNVKPIKTSKRSRPRTAYRAQIEAMLAELADVQLVAAWQRVCPLATDPPCEFPDRQGIIQDLADIAEALQPGLEDMTADQLCRQVEQYGGAANRENSSPSTRPKPWRVDLPASSLSATARTPR